MKNTFITNIDIDSCKTLITELINEEKSNGIRGKVSRKHDRFWIVKRSLNYHNSWQRYFYAQLTNYDGKTIIQGNFKMSKALKILFIWEYIFISFIFIVIIINFVKSLEINDKVAALHDFKALLPPFLLLAASFLLTTVFTKLGVKEENCLIKMLHSKLKLKEYKM